MWCGCVGGGAGARGWLAGSSGHAPLRGGFPPAAPQQGVLHGSRGPRQPSPTLWRLLLTTCTCAWLPCRASSGAVERATHTLKRINQEWQMEGQEASALHGVQPAAAHALNAQARACAHACTHTHMQQHHVHRYTLAPRPSLPAAAYPHFQARPSACWKHVSQA